MLFPSFLLARSDYCSIINNDWTQYLKVLRKYFLPYNLGQFKCKISSSASLILHRSQLLVQNCWVNTYVCTVDKAVWCANLYPTCHDLPAELSYCFWNTCSLESQAQAAAFWIFQQRVAWNPRCRHNFSLEVEAIKKKIIILTIILPFTSCMFHFSKWFLLMFPMYH